MRSIKGVPQPWGFEKVKLYKAQDFIEMTVAGKPDLFGSRVICFKLRELQL
jgi:hypothetical protein